MPSVHSESVPAPARAAHAWRWAGWVLLGVVLALSFLAYLSPAMQLQWETLAALCGF